MFYFLKRAAGSYFVNRPPVKAKRPWTPQPPAKPSNDHLYNNNAFANNNYNNNVPSYPATPGAPYAYPPPSTTIYQPSPPAQSYGSPVVVVEHEEEKEKCCHLGLWCHTYVLLPFLYKLYS